MDNKITKICILITCFNRINKTLLCLKHLNSLNLDKNTAVDVLLLDDCSSDGTELAVSELFRM